jgi:hypothetical protein
MIAHHKENGFLARLGFGTALAILATATMGVAQQGEPILQITSPASGVLVNPGQTIPVTVSSPTNSAFTKIILVGEFPIGFSDIATSLPAQFPVVVPADSAPRKFTLTASGFTTSGQEVESTPIFLDVERTDLPIKMASMPAASKFESQGAKLPLRIWGTFSDGSYLDITGSSYVAYSSSNVNVATVDATGVVTAVATGGATVKAMYTIGSQSVQVYVPITVPPPVLTTSPASLSFGTQAIGTTSPSQAITLTNVSNAPIGVITVAATGYFSETDNCVSSSPLAVGATCTVNVAFSPKAAGSKTGTIDVTNDLTVAPLSLPLSGTGVTLPSITSLPQRRAQSRRP